MDQVIYDAYLDILRKELVPALGCTEPIAIAFACAKARQALGRIPESLYVGCSGNIIKNAKGVAVPNSGGLKGIEAAAVLGTVGGDADRELEVLQGVKQEDIARAKELLAENFCTVDLLEGDETLRIVARARAGDDVAEVEIKDRHTHIARITKNGEALLEDGGCAAQDAYDGRALLNVKDILSFADEVLITDVQDILDRQIAYNSAIAQEGLSNDYGTQVGKTLLRHFGADVRTRARAVTAAGSDARMSGCPLPVVINSGSGNQGMTVSLPVIVYARELGATDEQLYRALVVANLISIHQKKYIGSLSAYCGATSAACGAACGIAYLYGGDYEVISNTIVNTIANVGGIICDGAKPSCAAKIASAVDAGIMGVTMSLDNCAFQPGEGLVEGDVERTIQNLGRVGRVGMKPTDQEILHIMIGK